MIYRETGGWEAFYNFYGPIGLGTTKEEALQHLKVQQMANEREISFREVAGGNWQAFYEGGSPNEFGSGATKEEALNQLHRNRVQGIVDLKHSMRVTTVENVKTDRVIVRKLPATTEIDGKVVTYVCFRENEPEKQAYGSTEQEARVNFLTAQPKSKK